MLHTLCIAVVLAAVLCCATGAGGAAPLTASEVASRLLPEPQQLTLGTGEFVLRGATLTVNAPAGPEHAACRTVLADALREGGAAARVQAVRGPACRFACGEGADLPPLPTVGHAEEAYVLGVGPRGFAAEARTPAGLLYAAQTVRQLARVFAERGWLPALQVADTPTFAWRGIYIEGGQERYGRIVDAAYLREQIRRLSSLKMNALVIECYNLFPFASFPACADAGTLSREDCRRLVEEARRWHVTLIPSLQTLAQSYELVWGCEAGKPYREPTAPGQMCPSTAEIYPFIKGLYRDLLTLFDTSPVIGIGCSEIEMQWQGRYCPKCRARIQAGETERDLLLGHALKCIQAVREVSAELGRPVRPLMWADEFYMYGPGHDWVGIDRIPRDTVMGYWKYWADYAGIGGLLQRGYDVFGISAIYNHCFYLADISPEQPKKAWPAMEETGVRNIAEMLAEAAKQAPGSTDGSKRTSFWGVATASFSKHRLRAFDTLWYGFALNAQCAWSRPGRRLANYQPGFTRAYVRHAYDCRTDAAVETLATAWERLDALKSQLELANQTLHDVVGVVDTQEPGYVGNSLLAALRACRPLLRADGRPGPELARIRAAAIEMPVEVARVLTTLDACRPDVGGTGELDDLRAAAEKIAAHAVRQRLLIDTQSFMARAPAMPPDAARQEAWSLCVRWGTHCAALRETARRDRRLYRQGDPCGDAALLRDVDAILRHLAALASPRRTARPGRVLLHEPFDRLDPARWIVLGEPRVVDGHLETGAPGGWERRCGIATREPLALASSRPLVVEFAVTPVKMGIDSQIFASADAAGVDSYRFSFYGPVDRFGIYTRAQAPLRGPWLDTAAGWRLRAQSGPVQPGREYAVRAELRQASFRIVVREAGATDWDIPFWDSGPVPMDPLPETRLRFADAEPEGRTSQTRWGPITIRRADR